MCVQSWWQTKVAFHTSALHAFKEEGKRQARENASRHLSAPLAAPQAVCAKLLCGLTLFGYAKLRIER